MQHVPGRRSDAIHIPLRGRNWRKFSEGRPNTSADVNGNCKRGTHQPGKRRLSYTMINPVRWQIVRDYYCLGGGQTK